MLRMGDMDTGIYINLSAVNCIVVGTHSIGTAKVKIKDKLTIAADVLDIQASAWIYGFATPGHRQLSEMPQRLARRGRSGLREAVGPWALMWRLCGVSLTCEGGRRCGALPGAPKAPRLACAKGLLAGLSVSMVHKKGAPMDRGHEVEAALIVYSDAPQAIEQRLADLQTLAEFSLLPRASQAIEDIYFDTADRSLQARLIALRVRRLDGTTLVTMKADSHRTAAGEDRLEIESPWSCSGLHTVVSELRSRGVGVPASSGEVGSADPAAVMASLGLEQVQTRATTRTPRDVVARGADSEPVAELAIDAVTYRFGEGRVRLLEVEVEAKGGGDASTVERITARLRDEFPTQLRPWPYGKLPTGKAIQELLADGQLDGLTGQDGMLGPVACERIAGLLGSAARSQPRQAPG